MNCIFCNNPITSRRKGDHVIPQGLGKFSPEMSVFCICRDCDSKNGNEFERIALRTGVLGVFRAIHVIKSKNHRNKPIHSPSLDRFSAFESKKFDIKNTSNPDETVYIGNGGKPRFTDKIHVLNGEETLGTIKIPPTRKIGEICDFIENTIAQFPKGSYFDLHINEDQFENVTEELDNRGRPLSNIRHLRPEPEFSIIEINTVITENNFRSQVSNLK